MRPEYRNDPGAILLAHSDGCPVWQFRNETGEGTMTTYEIFPGAILSFNDFHMAQFESRYVADRRLFALDHCREGRMEYTPGSNMLAYTAAGDIKPDLRKQHTGTFVFPSHHYHGLTIALDRDILSSSLPLEARDFPASTEAVIDRWALGDYPKVLHGADALEPLFLQLYHVPKQIRIPYFKVKTLELLLCLYSMDIPVESVAPPYFYRSQVEKIKAIARFLTEHISENYTQEALSRQFDIPMTTMKSCFRSVYGTAMGTWRTACRMNLAAELLIHNPDLSISQIAGQVGYDNAGKFTEAFKRTMRLTPSQYWKERGNRNEI